MKRDWESYFNKPNKHGVIPTKWENENKENNAKDKVISICPICKNEFIAYSISNVVNENTKQIKMCPKCSIEKQISSLAEKRKGTSCEWRRKYNLNIGDKTSDDLEIINIFYKNGRQWVSVRCLCGDIFDCVSESITRTDNKKTRKCLKCARKEQGKKRREDNKIKQGTKSYLLTALYPGEPQIINGWKHGTTVCRCECGNICVVLNSRFKSGNTKSCGCLKSWLEAQTSKFLTLKGIHFTHGYCIKNVLTSNGNPCQMDFQIKDEFNNRICFIECQGEQHYKDSGDFGRLQREETDALKKEYCREHNILLYEIKFDEDVETRVNEILTELNLIKEAI